MVSKGEPKIFYIGFVGTDINSFLPVVATSVKQAKEKFAEFQGVGVSSYIVQRKKVPRWVAEQKPVV
jgi:hypothetical protein